MTLSSSILRSRKKQDYCISLLVHFQITSRIAINYCYQIFLPIFLFMFFSGWIVCHGPLDPPLTTRRYINHVIIITVVCNYYYYCDYYYYEIRLE